MESTVAATLQKKKINKGKLKKTIKNLLCRPDAIFWPAVTEDQMQKVNIVLGKYKVPLPDYQKPLWKDLQSIPKEQRPRPPKIEKVNGLFFGISECTNTVRSGQCSGVIMEASINPRTIVQPILESCVDNRIPVICIEGLRKTTKTYFGITTSCLGVKNECLEDIRQVILELGSDKLPKKKMETSKVEDIEMIDNKKNVTPMDTQESAKFEYLYRKDKKRRVFIPPSEVKIKKEDKKFRGQDFIEFSDKSEQNKNTFKKMMVKRITNNPNRIKVK